MSACIAQFGDRGDAEFLVELADLLGAEALHVDLNRRSSISNVTKCNDLVAIDGDVADKGIATAAIVNIAATQDQVV